MSGVRFLFFFFFSSRRRHTRFDCDWSSDVCSSDLKCGSTLVVTPTGLELAGVMPAGTEPLVEPVGEDPAPMRRRRDRKSTRLNSSHSQISYAVFCLKKKKKKKKISDKHREITD